MSGLTMSASQILTRLSPFGRLFPVSHFASVACLTPIIRENSLFFKFLLILKKVILCAVVSIDFVSWFALNKSLTASDYFKEMFFFVLH